MKSERGKILFGNKKIKFVIKRSNRRKTVSIFVDPVEGVFLRTPSSSSIKTLTDLVRTKAAWILNKQQRIKEILEYYPQKEFVSGETFLYVGRPYRLRVKKGKPQKIIVRNGCLIVWIEKNLSGKQRKIKIKNILVNWYRRNALNILSRRIKIYSKKLRFSLPIIMLGNQTKRWGSCSQKDKIRFNWRIIMSPMSLIDYVVVHELCHLKYPDHSDKFWQLLGSIMPDYDIRREQLRKEGSKYNF